MYAMMFLFLYIVVSYSSHIQQLLTIKSYKIFFTPNFNLKEYFHF